jgi:uncharacterized protein DUF4440
MHFLLVCAMVTSFGAPQQAAPAQDEVLKREQQRVDLLTSGKYDQLADMLSPTLSYTHSSGVLEGKDKILADLRSGQVVYKTLRHRDVQVRFPSPDVAILNGASDVTVAIGGKEQEIPLRFTIVYVRKKGVWLMEAWHSARTAPPPAPR